MEGKLVDVTKLKPQGFKVFQMSMFSPAEPIVPFGKSRLKATNTELAIKATVTSDLVLNL